MDTNELVPCGCGCGTLMNPIGRRGRVRAFLPSHGSHFKTKKQESVPCAFCGKTLMRAPWQTRKAERQFCNGTCRAAWLQESGSVRGANNGHYNTITVGCATCGAPVSKARSLIERRNGRVYCPACVADSRPPFPPAGTINPADWTKKLRAEIRGRDGYACQWCGDRQGKATFHVHHIDYDRQHGDGMNLVTLCPPCHMQTNWGMGIWRQRFAALMRRRFPDGIHD